jgi:hypothetical protein
MPFLEAATLSHTSYDLLRVLFDIDRPRLCIQNKVGRSWSRSDDMGHFAA